MQQRVKALELFLADAYGPQRAVRAIHRREGHDMGFDDIVGKGKELFEGAKDKAEEVAEKIGDFAEGVAEKAEAAFDEHAAPVLEDVKDKAGDFFDSAKDKAEDVVADVKDRFDGDQPPAV